MQIWKESDEAEVIEQEMVSQAWKRNFLRIFEDKMNVGVRELDGR